MLLSPRQGAARLEIARCPTEGCLSIRLDKPFQSLCCGDSCGTAQERGPEPSYLGRHQAPRAPLSPQGYKAERGAGRHGGRGSCSL